MIDISVKDSTLTLNYICLKWTFRNQRFDRSIANQKKKKKKKEKKNKEKEIYFHMPFGMIFHQNKRVIIKYKRKKEEETDKTKPMVSKKTFPERFKFSTSLLSF